MKSGALKIASIYTAIALVWIFSSDKLLQVTQVFADPDQALWLNILKGSAFVIITGFILYKLIGAHERLLLASEKQFRSYFEDNPVPMWIYNSSTLFFIAVNDAAVSHYGYSRAEFKQMRITDIRPKEDAERLIEAVKNLSNGYNDSGVWSHCKKDGELIEVQISSHRLISGKRDDIMTMATDITELKRLETEKNEYLARVEDTLNSISDGYITLDRDWNIGMVNNMHEVISGFKKEDVLGKNFLTLWPDDTKSNFHANINCALSEHNVVKFEEYSKTLKKWLRLSCFPTKEGVAIYFSDITESKQKDILLQHALARYDKAAQTTQDMLYEFDLANNKVTFSQSFGFFSAIDLSVADNPSATWLALVHPDDMYKLTEINMQSMREGRSKNYSEYRVDCGNKNYRWVSDHASITYDPTGQPTQMIGAIRDINELKEKEASLLRQNMILKDIAWIESHEIRRPLASILALIEMARTSELDTEREEVLKLLNCSAIELDNMIRRVSAQIDEVTQEHTTL